LLVWEPTPRFVFFVVVTESCIIADTSAFTQSGGVSFGGARLGRAEKRAQRATALPQAGAQPAAGAAP
jgi:hypothetical protein